MECRGYRMNGELFENTLNPMDTAGMCKYVEDVFGETDRFFIKTFEISIFDNIIVGDRYDTIVSKIESGFYGSARINYLAFDAWLHEKYGNYESEGMSMETVLIKHYGEDVAKRIRKL
jgi:hypothetical protein